MRKSSCVRDTIDETVNFPVGSGTITAVRNYWLDDIRHTAYFSMELLVSETVDQRIHPIVGTAARAFSGLPGMPGQYKVNP